MSDKFVIDIKDFQSLKNVHLDLPKGVTIITGKTNEGKSSVFRAIDAALFNLGDDSMIRGGQRYYGVSIDNGSHKMVFMRDGKGKNEKSAYQFDGGTVQKKVGRTQLSEVADYFNIRDVKMQNGTKMKINFWYQNDKPFLTDKTSGQLYEFLSLSSCDRYSRVLKTMKADEKVIESNINSVTAEIDTLKVINNKKQDFIDKNKGFDETYVKVVTLSQEVRKLNDMESLLQSLKSILMKINDSKDRLKEVTKQYNRIPIEKITESYSKIADNHKEIHSEIKDVQDIKRVGEAIETVKSELGDKKKSLELCEDFRENINKKLSTIDTDYYRISELSKVIEQYQDTGNSIKTLTGKAGDVESRLFKGEKGVAERLKHIEGEISRLSELIFTVSYIEDSERSLKTVRDKLNTIEEDIKSNDKDLEDLKESAGFCPFCGTVFSK